MAKAAATAAPWPDDEVKAIGDKIAHLSIYEAVELLCYLKDLGFHFEITAGWPKRQIKVEAFKRRTLPDLFIITSVPRKNIK